MSPEWASPVEVGDSQMHLRPGRPPWPREGCRPHTSHVHVLGQADTMALQSSWACSKTGPCLGSEGSLSYTGNKGIIITTVLTDKTTSLLWVMLLIFHSAT